MDRYYLDVAYHLGLQNVGNTAPNPSVGAVVVRDNRVIGQAFHERAGEPHAEVLAIERAGAGATGATLYCSLEPCQHYGKTPPCTDRIVAAGISRVVFAVSDQNPLVAGKGKEELTRRGVQVDQIRSETIERFYVPFFHRFRKNRPYITAKVAMTANGIISPADRNSRWISNETSLAWVHQLRAQCDAILVGADTVILDRPHLTVRAEGVSRVLTRIVLDWRFKLTPDNCSLLENNAPILICGSDNAPPGKEDVWKQHGVRTLRFSDPVSLVQHWLKEGIGRILLEGGQKVFTLFHTAGLIDQYSLILAPRLLTGKHFLNILAGPEQSLHESVRMQMDTPIELDGDIILRFYPTETAAAANP
ncbi:MAG TPA: bifunctional diaminohydroxyphosphoribosylaminopyrimidine deaminase/5-amino-6-(5-phosphoribosylamino)uracil reductase RibD [Acidobacteriota bacterium]|nr:bifunctional diaminohydroxyphosphoribosylaminopyrimidine deaminase/5-amino-6-(5-phosphoribosylamino)uracil reductase RibD [Acidobacteriota bacterium]